MRRWTTGQSEASGSDEDGSEASDDGEGGEDEEGEDEYMSRLEKDLDRMYDAYTQRRKLVENLKDKADAQLKADEAEAMEGEKEEDEDDEDDVESDEELYEAMRERAGSKHAVADGEEEEEKRNPLLVQLTEKEKVSAAKRMERWFGRDVFGSLEDKSEASEGEDAKAKVGGKRKRSLSDMVGPDIATDSSDDSDDEQDDDDEAGSRWLSDANEDGDGEEQLTRKQRADLRAASQEQKEKPLVGLDALSKTREQAEADQKKQEQRVKKNAREERRLQRKLEAGATGHNEQASVEEDEDDAHMLVDQDSAKKAKKMKKRLDRLRGVTSGEEDGGFETVSGSQRAAVVGR